jgi:spermidine synthase
MALRQTAVDFFGRVHPEARGMFGAGALAAIIQTLLIREVLTVVAGNELVIGVMLAIWLAATAAGSGFGTRYPFCRSNITLFMLLFVAVGAMTGIRAARLLLMPGSSLPPQLLLSLLAATEAPVAFLGGYVFGTLAGRGRGANIYGWEQAGTLAGLMALSIAVAAYAPNYPIAAAGAFLCIVPLLKGAAPRWVAVLILALFIASDHYTAAWKYPLPIDRIVYAHEGEVARATVDGQRITFVNGAVYTTAYSTPAVEQAVHTPLGMHPHVRSVLIVNNAGHLAEARKYPDMRVRCIRTDRLIDDTCCQCARFESVEQWKPFDAVILGCGMPDNAATSRFFTRGFFARMHTLTGNAGIFSFTLPLQSEYQGGQDRVVRDIIVSTMKSVFRYVRILPGEGLSFTASDTDYPLPDTCRVPNDYFQNTILAGLSPERIRTANAPPRVNDMHTAARPLLLHAALKRYLEQFGVEWWMAAALPALLFLGLLPLFRKSMDALSIGSSGFCAGVFSVAILLLYQSVYGTVYAQLSLLLLSLAGGFTAGSFVRKFPLSDSTIGFLTGGMLFGLSLPDTPPAPPFFIANIAAGFLVSAQFVTRKRTSAGILYGADCAGGVLGMSLASTVLIPLFGLAAVAAGLAVMKAAVEIAAAHGSREP